MTMGRGRRVAWILGGVVAGAALLAVAFAEPRTLSRVVEDFVTVLAGPVHPAWLRVRTTGPIRRALVGVELQLLPVLLLPVYAIRPGRLAATLSAVGAALWMTSGFMMLALRYVD